MSFCGSVSLRGVKLASQGENIDIEGEPDGRVLISIISDMDRTIGLWSVALIFMYNKIQNL